MKKQSAVSSQRSASLAIARRKLEQSAKKLRTCGSVIPPAVVHPRFPVVAAVADRGPQTRDQHLSALAAKLDRNHSALFTVATGIVNLKRKLRRQEELYRTLALNYGSRHAEHTRQVVELSKP